ARRMACQRCGAPPAPVSPKEPESEPPELAEAGPDTQTVMMGAAWAANTEAFALLMRYHGQARRDYYKALKQLELLRTGKAGYLPQEPTPLPDETAVDKTDLTPQPPEIATETADNQTKPHVPRPEAAAVPFNETKPNYGADSHESETPAGRVSQKMTRFFGNRGHNLDD